MPFCYLGTESSLLIVLVKLLLPGLVRECCLIGSGSVALLFIRPFLQAGLECVLLLCATFVIPGQSTVEYLKQHVPRVQRSIAADNTVPETHQIWSSGEKVMQGLFPWIGVGEVYKEIESTRYTLLQFINSSILTDAL